MKIRLHDKCHSTTVHAAAAQTLFLLAHFFREFAQSSILDSRGMEMKEITSHSALLRPLKRLENRSSSIVSNK